MGEGNRYTASLLMSGGSDQVGLTDIVLARNHLGNDNINQLKEFTEMV